MYYQEETYRDFTWHLTQFGVVEVRVELNGEVVVRLDEVVDEYDYNVTYQLSTSQRDELLDYASQLFSY